MKIVLLVLSVIQLVTYINAIITIDDIKKCDHNLKVAAKYYTLINNTFDTTITVTARKHGVSGDLILFDELRDATANILENTLTLFNGRIVNYDNKECFSSQQPLVDFDCKTQGENERIYYSGPAEEIIRGDNTKHIIFTKRNKQYTFQIKEEEEYQRCGRKIWKTGYDDVLAFEHSNKDDCSEHKNLTYYAKISEVLLAQFAHC